MSVRNSVALVLVFLTGLILGQLLKPSLEFQPMSSAQERSTEVAAVAFYEAVNRYLELGDADVLADVLDASFVDHSATGPNQDMAGLVRYLAAMRATYPDMRIAVANMTPRNDVIAIAVATTHGTAMGAGALIPDRLPSAPGYEQLRIVDGKVAERWASRTLPPQFELIASLDLNFLSGWFVGCAMETLVLAPGVSEIQRQYSISLLIASSESVALEIDRRDSPDAPLLMSGDYAIPTALERGKRIELEKESVVMFPEEESYRIWNTGKNPATAIVIGIQYRPSSVVFINAQNAWIDPTTHSNDALSVGLLPMGTDSDRAHAFSLVRISASPGERLLPHEVDGLEQALVIEGALDVEVHSGSVVLSGPEGRVMAAPGDRRPLLPGDGMIADSGASLSYQVMGDDPATIWFVQIVPAPVLAE